MASCQNLQRLPRQNKSKAAYQKKSPLTDPADSEGRSRYGAVKPGKSGAPLTQLLAQPTKGKEREGVVSGRWAPRPMEGKAKGREREAEREGRRGTSQGGKRPMGTTAYGGNGSKGRAANGDQPVGAASCRREQYTMASCQTPNACLGQTKVYC